MAANPRYAAQPSVTTVVPGRTHRWMIGRIPSVYKFDVPPGHQTVIDAKHPLLPDDSAAVVLPLHHYGLVHLNGPPRSSKLEESRGIQ